MKQALLLVVFVALLAGAAWLFTQARSLSIQCQNGQCQIELRHVWLAPEALYSGTVKRLEWVSAQEQPRLRAKQSEHDSPALAARDVFYLRVWRSEQEALLLPESKQQEQLWLRDWAQLERARQQASAWSWQSPPPWLFYGMSISLLLAALAVLFAMLKRF